jgi:hypothetical protein
VNVRDVLRTDVFRTLKGAGCRLVILSPAPDEPEFVREFGAENVHLEPLHPYVPGPNEEKLLNLRCTLFSDLSQTTSILSDVGPAAHLVKRTALKSARLAAKVLGRRPTEDLLALATRTLFPTRATRRCCRSTGRSGGADARVRLGRRRAVLKAATQMKIPTVLLVASWDNLTKGVFPSRPDRLVVWNPIMFEEAQELHGFRPEQIFIGGVPQFDLYADKSQLPDRRTFFERVGRSRQGPHQLLHDRSQALPRRVRRGGAVMEGLPGRAPPQALPDPGPGPPALRHPGDGLHGAAARPARPAHRRAWTGDHQVHRSRSDRRGHEAPGGHGPAQRRGHQHPLDHCHRRRGARSPVVCAGFDGNRTLPYKQSVRRYLDYSHYRKMLDIGGVRVASSPDELLGHVNAYLADPPKIARAGPASSSASAAPSMARPAGVWASTCCRPPKSSAGTTEADPSVPGVFCAPS